MSARPSAECGWRVRRTTSGLSKHPFYACCYRVVVQQPGGGITHPLDDVGQTEDRFLARKTPRQAFQHLRQTPDLLLGNLLCLAQ